MTPQEKEQFEELKEKVKSLENYTTISYPVEQAFRTRFQFDSLTPITGSVKGVTSENQSVNEAGIAVYSVLKPPDAFLQVTVGSTTYYIPVFT